MLGFIQAHPKVFSAQQVGQTGAGDKEADLVVQLKGGGPVSPRMVQCRTKDLPDGMGLHTEHKKFAGVTFVFLNSNRRVFYVLMPEDLGDRFGTAAVAPFGIPYGPTDAEEVAAFRKAADKVVSLLPRSKVYNTVNPALSPTHVVEQAGMSILKQVAGALVLQPMDSQADPVDLTYAGHQVQLKCATE